MTHVIGPDFLALRVRDLDRSTAFYEQEIGCERAPTPPDVAGVVVFQSATIPVLVESDPRPILRREAR